VNEAIANGTAPPTTEQQATPLNFQNVPEGAGTSGNSVTVEVSPPTSTNGDANSTTGVGAPAANSYSGSSAAPAPAASGTPAGATPLVAPVGPTNDKPLPAIDKPAEAPQQVNEVPGGQAQVQTGATTANNKKKKAPYDKKDESSSKHKKKTGLDKLNPF
jgi:outer membrane protein assembly factor BamD